MKRKVIQLAGRTLLISLPKPWTVQHHIRKGQELNITEQDNNLIVSHKPSTTTTKTSITVTKDTFVKNEIAFLYQKGVDEITVNYPNAQELYDEIKERTNNLLGFEIVNQTAHSCTIKNISAPQVEAFDTIFRRTWHVLNTMAEEGNKKNIMAMEQTINKLTDFCKRLLNKYPTPTQSYQYAIVRDLEKIGDQYAALCKEKNVNSSHRQDINDFLKKTELLVFNFKENNIKAYLKQRHKINQLKIKSQELNVIKQLLSELYGPTFMLNS